MIQSYKLNDFDIPSTVAPDDLDHATPAPPPSESCLYFLEPTLSASRCNRVRADSNSVAIF